MSRPDPAALALHALPPRAWRHVAAIGLATAAIFGGVLLALYGKPWGWALAVAGLVGAAAATALLLPGANALRVHAEGFEVVAGWRRHAVAWDDVGPPRRALGPEGDVVVVDFADPSAHAALRALGLRTAGIDGALPDTYGVSADDLVELMRDAHRAALDRRAGGPVAEM